MVLAASCGSCSSHVSGGVVGVTEFSWCQRPVVGGETVRREREERRCTLVCATFSPSALNYAVEPLVTLAPTRHPHNTSRLRHQPGCSTDSVALELATPGGRTQSHADVAATAGTPQDHRLVGVCCCKNRRMRGVLKCLIVTSHPAGAARSAARTRALQPQAGS